MPLEAPQIRIPRPRLMTPQHPPRHPEMPVLQCPRRQIDIRRVGIQPHRFTGQPRFRRIAAGDPFLRAGLVPLVPQQQRSHHQKHDESHPRQHRRSGQRRRHRPPPAAAAPSASSARTPRSAGPSPPPLPTSGRGPRPRPPPTGSASPDRAAGISRRPSKDRDPPKAPAPGRSPRLRRSPVAAPRWDSPPRRADDR